MAEETVVAASSAAAVKVWTVACGYYEDKCVRAIFSTKEGADSFFKKYEASHDAWEPREFMLDQIPDGFAGSA